MEKRKSYKKQAEEILTFAKKNRTGSRVKGYRDNKTIISLEKMTSLLGAGAEIFNLNSSQVDGNPFLHEVIYESHRFLATSKEPYAPYITASLH